MKESPISCKSDEIKSALPWDMHGYEINFQGAGEIARFKPHIVADYILPKSWIRKLYNCAPFFEKYFVYYLTIGYITMLGYFYSRFSSDYTIRQSNIYCCSVLLIVLIPVGFYSLFLHVHLMVYLLQHFETLYIAANSHICNALFVILSPTEPNFSYYLAIILQQQFPPVLYFCDACHFKMSRSTKASMLALYFTWSFIIFIWSWVDCDLKEIEWTIFGQTIYLIAIFRSACTTTLIFCTKICIAFYMEEGAAVIITSNAIRGITKLQMKKNVIEKETPKKINAGGGDTNIAQIQNVLEIESAEKMKLYRGLVLCEESWIPGNIKMEQTLDGARLEAQILDSVVARNLGATGKILSDVDPKHVVILEPCDGISHADVKVPTHWMM